MNQLPPSPPVEGSKEFYPGGAAKGTLWNQASAARFQQRKRDHIILKSGEQVMVTPQVFKNVQDAATMPLYIDRPFPNVRLSASRVVSLEDVDGFSLPLV